MKEDYCYICNKSGLRDFTEAHGRRYLKCSNCSAVVMNSSYWLSENEEKQRYELHQNNMEDSGYVSYLYRFINPLLEKLNESESIRRSNQDQNSFKGLDYGCGPTKVLAEIMSKHGYDMDAYDPYFYREEKCLDEKYDLITMTEVAEHLYKPAEEFKRLSSMLQRDGFIAVMTVFIPENMEFSRWHYLSDATHVHFYCRKTFEIIAETCGLKAEFPAENIVFLKY